MKEKIERLEIIFTQIFEILDIDFDKFNHVYKLDGEKLEKLLELEKKYPEIGLHTDRHNNYQVDGVSVVSLFATITDILCGRRFSTNVGEVDKKNKILGKAGECKLLKFNYEGNLIL